MILGGLVLIIGIVTWLLSMEGAWGAASSFLCVLIAGLLAMNYFEPLALYLTFFVPAIAEYADFVALVGLFGGLTFGLRELTAWLSPVDIRLPDLFDTIGKWVFSAVTGYVTMAILLTSLHTAPLPRDFFDFHPETPAFLGLAPDRQWLGFVQYVSENSLKRSIQVKDPLTGMPVADPVTQLPLTMPNIFDGQYRRVGDPQAPHPNTIWSSFPIRYAMRRSQIEQGGLASATAAPAAAPAPTSGSAPAAGGF